MRTIAVILGDNDYGSTFLPLMETLKRAMEYRSMNPELPWLVQAMGRPERLLTEQDVRHMITEMVMGHYVAFQYSYNPQDYRVRNKSNMQEPTSQEHEEELASTREYLNRIRILFDEEAEQDIANKDHDHGAWYLDLQSGVIGDY